MTRTKMEDRNESTSNLETISAGGMDIEMPETPPSTSLLDRINIQRNDGLFKEKAKLVINRNMIESVIDAIKPKSDLDVQQSWDDIEPSEKDSTHSRIGRGMGKQDTTRDSSPETPPTPSSCGYVSPWDGDQSEEDDWNDSDSEPDHDQHCLKLPDMKKDRRMSLHLVDGWWDEMLPTLSNLSLLRNPAKCDLLIVLNKTEETVLAHSYVLASRSDKLAKPLEKQQYQKWKHLKILDINVHLFLIYLRYLYTDDLVLSSVSEAIRMLEIAQRCGPKSFMEVVIDYIQTNVTVKNVFEVAKVAHTYKSQRLSNRAITFIINNASKTLLDKSFCKLCRSCVERIVKSEDIQENEFTIYLAVQYWAEAECTRQRLKPKPENLRAVLGDVLYCVRFPLINFQSINREFSVFKALSESERKALYKYHIGKANILPHYFNNTKRKFDELNRQMSPLASTNSPAMSRVSNDSGNSLSSIASTVSSSKKSVSWSPSVTESEAGDFIERRERHIILNRAMRFKSMTGPWTMRRPETLSFKFSKPVVLCGIMMFAAHGSDEVYNLDIKVKTGDEPLLDEKSAVRNFEKKPRQVLFSKDVPICPGQVYDITVTMPQKPTYIGVDGMNVVEVNKTKITFISTCLNDLSRGQIPGLLFRNVLNDQF